MLRLCNSKNWQIKQNEQNININQNDQLNKYIANKGRSAKQSRISSDTIPSGIVEFVKLERKSMLPTAGETLTRKPIDKGIRRRWKSFWLHADAMLWIKSVPETFRLEKIIKGSEKRKMWSRVRHILLLCG